MFYLECIDLFEEVYHNDDFTGLIQYLFHSGFCPLSDKELEHGIAGWKEFKRRKLEERKLKKQRPRLPKSPLDKYFEEEKKYSEYFEYLKLTKPPSTFTTDYYPGGELLPALVWKDLGYPRKYSTPSIDLNIAFRFCLGVSRLVSTSNIFLPKPKLGSLDWAKLPLDWGKKPFSWKYEEERKREEKEERRKREERREKSKRRLKAWKKRKAKRAKELRKNLTTLGGLLLLTICSWAVCAPLGSLFLIGTFVWIIYITSKGEKKEGCFIATATYGLENAYEATILRSFRDAYLLKSHLGKKLVLLYYGVSPSIARLIENCEHLKLLVRFLLGPLITLIKHVIKRGE